VVAGPAATVQRFGVEEGAHLERGAVALNQAVSFDHHLIPAA
jgi:hypothetical protein